MIARVAVVCAVVCSLAVDCSPLDKHQRELKEHYDHLAVIAEFKCQDPQRRSISITKLLSEQEVRGKTFFPDVTVLGRCDCESGACLAGHTCAAAHSDPVMLPVKATFLHDIERYKKGSWQIEYHQFDNHTSCSCVPTTPLQPSDQDHGPPEGLQTQTVRVIHEHYIVPSSEIQQYQEVLASLPAIEQAYNGQTGHNLPEPSNQQQPQDQALYPTNL